MAHDFYSILGVARDADEAAIKSAFRKGAMKFHPDRNQDDPEAEHKFKEINEAYEVLSDPQKRAAYDRYGHAAFKNGGANGFGGFAPSRSCWPRARWRNLSSSMETTARV